MREVSRGASIRSRVVCYLEGYIFGIDCVLVGISLHNGVYNLPLQENTEGNHHYHHMRVNYSKTHRSGLYIGAKVFLFHSTVDLGSLCIQ